MLQTPDRDGIANRLLLSLPEVSLNRLRPRLRLCATTRGQVVNRADREAEHYYFTNRGLISLVKLMEDGRAVEIGVVGIEGLTNVYTLFGLNRVGLETVVQIPGEAFVISRNALLEAMRNDRAVGAILERYMHFAYSALAHTAACNRLHYIEQRCCRWLLIAHDSARTDTFLLTQEFLAMMLGVQRSGVSVAAQFLQKSGLIRYRRGQVTVADRAGLEAAACECYRTMHAYYRKAMTDPENA